MTKTLVWGVSLFSLTVVILFQNCAGKLDTASNFQQSTSSKSPSTAPTETESTTASTTSSSGSNYTFPGSASSFFSSPSSGSSANNSSSTGSSSAASSVTTVPSNQLPADSLALIAPGATCSYVKSLAGLGYQQLLNDFAAAFDGSSLKTGESINWASGVLTRNANGSMNYTDPKTQLTILR